MTPLIILFSLLAFLFVVFLSFKSLILFRKIKQMSGGDSARDIYILKHDNHTFKEGETNPNVDMDSDLISEIKTQQNMENRIGTERTLNEKRKHPRKDFETFVEFIKEGTLFKGTSTDLSYSGIFLQSKTPEQYNLYESIVLSFQTSKGRPQKRHGQIVRIETNGIGIRFLKKEEKENHEQF